MEIELSTPDKLNFFDRIRKWFESQKERIWISTPYVDEMGVSLLNSSCMAQDVRLITRKNRYMDGLNKRINVKINQHIHTKLYIGDASAYVGSSNLTYASLLDNIELLIKIEDEKMVSDLEGYYKVLWA